MFTIGDRIVWQEYVQGAKLDRPGVIEKVTPKKVRIRTTKLGTDDETSVLAYQTEARQAASEEYASLVAGDARKEPIHVMLSLPSAKQEYDCMVIDFLVEVFHMDRQVASDEYSKMGYSMTIGGTEVYTKYYQIFDTCASFLANKLGVQSTLSIAEINEKSNELIERYAEMYSDSEE